MARGTYAMEVFDLDSEQPIELSQAAQLVAGEHGRCSVDRIRRWIRQGVSGPGGVRVRLQGNRIGGKVVTSREALRRFVRQSSEGSRPSQTERPSPAAVTAQAALHAAGY